VVIDQDVVTVWDPSGQIIAVEIFDSRGPFVRPYGVGGVHVDHVGRGVGTALFGWAARRADDQIAKAPPDAQVTFSAYTAGDHESSAELMRAGGLELARYFLTMEIDFDGPPPQPVVPEGVTIRPFDPATEVAALSYTVRESFRDHYGFVETPMEEGIARLRHWMTSTEHDPTLWWVALAEGEIVGFNLCDGSHEGDESVGYVGSLGVLRAFRGRGLGRALLLVSFNEFHNRHKRGAALGVDADSLTGATRLYESVGMRPATKYAAWEKVIRAGVELATVDVPDA